MNIQSVVRKKEKMEHVMGSVGQYVEYIQQEYHILTTHCCMYVYIYGHSTIASGHASKCPQISPLLTCPTSQWFRHTILDIWGTLCDDYY